MKDQNRTKTQLITELNKIRLHVQELQEADKRHKQIITTLRASEDNLRTTLNSIGDAVITTDINGRITHMNPVAGQLTGWTDEDAAGKPLVKIFNIINEESRRKVENPVERVLRDGVVAGLANHTLLISKDGREIPIADSGAPIRNDNGEITGVVLVFRDQTEERTAQRINARLATIIENSDDAIIGKTLAGIITSWNNAAQRMYGYSAEEAIGKSIFIIIPPERRKELPRILERISRGKRIEHFETVRMRKDGKRIFVSVTVSPIKDREGKIIGVSSIGRDISKHKQAEEALQRERDRAQKYLDIAGVIFIAMNDTGEVTLINKKGSEVLGYKQEEIIGKNWFDSFLPVSIKDQVKTVFKRLMAGKIELTEYFENPVLIKGGEEKIIAWHNTILKDEKGNIVGTLSSGEDITERKQTEKALRESEEQLRIITENTTDSIVLTTFDLKATFIYVNASVKYTLGYDPEELLGKSFFDFIHPEDKKVLLPLLKKYVNQRIKNFLDRKESPITETIEFRFKNKIGNWRFMQSDVNIVGKQLLAVTRDITERKQAEERIRESEERFRLAFHTNPDAISISRLSDSTYIDINPGFSKITGYTRGDVIGRSALEINIWHDPNDRTRLIEKLQKDGVVDSLEANFRMKNGKVKIGLLSAAVMQLDKEAVLLSIAKDITERKRMEKMRNAQYNINRAMVTALDIDTLFEVIRDEVADLIDVKNFIFALYDEKTDLLHTTFRRDEKDMIPPFWKAEKSLTGQVIRLKKSLLLKKKEINKRIKKGEIEKLGTIPEIWMGIPLLAGEKAVGAIVLQDYDKTDAFDETTVQMLEVIAREMGIYISRKQVEAERELLSAAIEQAAEVVVITDTRGSIEYVNPAFERLTGYSRREAIGQNPRILKSGEQDEAFYHNLWETISSGKIWQGRFVNRRKDLTVFTEEATISPVFDNAGKIVNYVAVKRDITRELELEQQYQQAQRMESIGRLAGGVAHDFNNLLTVINGYATLIMNDLNQNDPIYADTKEILNAGERAGKLTQQLLAFSRKQIFRLENFNLNDVIADLQKMMHRLLGEDIEINIIPDKNLADIRADMGQVEQVIINLAVNARDAMPEGGRLTIETQNVTLDKEYTEMRPQVAPGHYVLLAISDTGEGMDQETQNQIFEPFFTTKEIGKGTGLGLATVYGILKQSGGFIWVYSEVGKGTTFKVYFPASEGANTDQKPQEKSSVSLRGNETILLVEDEDGVRNLAFKALKEKGYRVLAAKNGGEALLICEEQSQPIDLIVTDVVMPHMSGKQFVAKISKTRPEIKVIYTSGYTDNVIVYHGILDRDINFIHKPFSPDTLLQEVRRVLDTDR